MAWAFKFGLSGRKRLSSPPIFIGLSDAMEEAIKEAAAGKFKI
jgi:hypothetical protein